MWGLRTTLCTSLERSQSEPTWDKMPKRTDEAEGETKRKARATHPYFAANLAWYVKASRLSYAEIERRCGTSKSLISRYANGKGFPRYHTCYKLAKALGVSIEALWDHVPPPTFKPPT